jgi:hypothetical protein
MARTIRIDDEVWHELQRRAVAFEDTPNSVLRKVLRIDNQRGSYRPEAGESDEASRNPRSGKGHPTYVYNYGDPNPLFGGGGEWRGRVTEVGGRFPGLREHAISEYVGNTLVVEFEQRPGTPRIPPGVSAKARCDSLYRVTNAYVEADGRRVLVGTLVGKGLASAIDVYASVSASALLTGASSTPTFYINGERKREPLLVGSTWKINGSDA